MGKPNPHPAARHRLVIRTHRRDLTRSLFWFLVPFSIFLLRAGYSLYVSDDLKVLHLGFQRFHQPFLDTIFKWITFLGDGIFVGVVVLTLILFVHLRAGLFVLTASVLDSVIVQYLKHRVFADHYRPIHYFRDHPDLMTVPGVEMHENFSFPSGHTAAAFCMYFSLALIVRHRAASLVFCVIALAVGWSRIQLNQHFLEDVYLGSLIGTAVAAMVFPFFYKREMNPTTNALDRPLIRL